MADLDGLHDDPDEDAAGSGAGAGSGSSATSSAPGAGGQAGSSPSTSSSSAGPGSGGSAGFDPPWFDAAWTARARVVVQNDSVAELPVDFETGFHLEIADVFPGATPESLRMARWDESGSSWSWIPTFVETIEGETWLWTPLADVIAEGGGTIDHYWLYAANSSPPAPDDPASVFKIVWQPFDDLGGWAIGDTPAVVGGSVILESSDTVYTAQKFGPGYAFDFEMKVEALPPCLQGCWLAGGFQDKFNAEPWLLWITRDNTPAIWAAVEISERSVSFVGNQVPLSLGVPVVYGVERFANHVAFRRQNALVMNVSSWVDDWSLPVPARLAAVGGGKASISWARVRRAADPPPNVTVDNVEFY